MGKQSCEQIVTARTHNMSLLSTALCLLAVATIGSSAGIPLNKDGHEFTLDDVLSFHQKKAESVDIDTSSIDPSIKEDAKLSVVSVVFAMANVICVNENGNNI